MVSPEGQHSILFSHLDPEIFVPSQCEQFVPELLVSSLLQGEVLLLAADLVTNRVLAEFLSQEPQIWRLAEDLIRNSGAITMIVHPLGEYPPECEFDPLTQPLQSWAWMVEHRRLFGSEVFHPSGVQQSFYRRVDEAFSGTGHVRPSGSLPTRTANTFAAYFRSVLTDGLGMLMQIDDFKILNRRTVERYVEFAGNDSAWKLALEEQGQLPRSLEQTEFYRSAAYRCLRLFSMSEQEGMAWKSLFQSVFYSNFCTNIGVVGRFGGRLHDLPLDFTITEEPRDTELIQLRLASSYAALKLELKEGIGDAVRKTREAIRIDEEDPLQHVWTSTNPEEQFTQVWGSIVGIFASFVGAQEAAMCVSPELGLLFTPDATSPIGISLRVDPVRMTKFIINLLQPAYKRYRVERNVKEQIMGMASVRAVRLTGPEPANSVQR